MKATDEMALGVRSALARLALITLAALLVSCQPAYQLDLVGTRWSIIEIDGTPIDTPTPALAFGADPQAADHAVLSLACEDVPLEWVWDTDGSALNLVAATSPQACRASITPKDAAVLDAIAGVESWSVQGSDEITLQGARQLRLDRIAPTGGG